jgi:AraC-like DNA-binding protein/quercetin dioxygenase-like cupin family protein
MSASSARVLALREIFPRGQDFHVNRQTLDDRARDPHTHRDFLEYVLVLKGTLAQRINGVECQHQAGELFLVRERDEHAVYAAPGQRARFWNIAFPVTVAAEALRYLDALPALNTLRGPGPLLVKPLALPGHRDFARRLEAAAGRFPGAALPLRVLLVEVFSLLLPGLASAPWAGRARDASAEPYAPPEWLTDLCAALQEPGRFLTDVQTLPHLAHKSPEHLARSFRKYLGTTPSEYLNALRLDWAAARLAGSSDKILAIALDAGFNEAGYFYRRFKERFGLPPKQYRERARRLADPGGGAGAA